MKQRCAWCSEDPLYLDYHDQEWGVPQFDEVKLFEKLCLEGAQAGLSWLTILKKRESYRAAFDGFLWEKIARYNENDVTRLLADVGIVRNRLKVRAAIKNARAVMTLKEQGDSFVDFLWRYVDGRPRQNAWKTMAEVPAQTKESQQMSKDLKALGFTFVGPTICYAFMQSVGMVNDHTVDCFRYPELRR